MPANLPKQVGLLVKMARSGRKARRQAETRLAEKAAARKQARLAVADSPTKAA